VRSTTLHPKAEKRVPGLSNLEARKRGRRGGKGGVNKGAANKVPRFAVDGPTYERDDSLVYDMNILGAEVDPRDADPEADRPGGRS
jgi:hypothetical protein